MKLPVRHHAEISILISMIPKPCKPQSLHVMPVPRYCHLVCVSHDVAPDGRKVMEVVPVGYRPVSVVGITSQRVRRSEQAIDLRDLFSRGVWIGGQCTLEPGNGFLLATEHQ